jgi:hypothetical protein
MEGSCKTFDHSVSVLNGPPGLGASVGSYLFFAPQDVPRITGFGQDHIPRNRMYDVDANRITRGTTRDDFVIGGAPGGNFTIKPASRAFLDVRPVVGRTTEPDFAECTATPFKRMANPLSLSRIEPGSYFCIKSSSGRFGWLRYDGSRNGKLELTFTLWGVGRQGQ